MDVGEFKYSLRIADKIITNRINSGRWGKAYGNSIKTSIKSFSTFMESRVSDFDSMETLTREWIIRIKDKNESLNNYRVAGKLMESIGDCLLAIEEVG